MSNFWHIWVGIALTKSWQNIINISWLSWLLLCSVITVSSVQTYITCFIQSFDFNISHLTAGKSFSPIPQELWDQRVAQVPFCATRWLWCFAKGSSIYYLDLIKLCALLSGWPEGKTQNDFANHSFGPSTTRPHIGPFSFLIPDSSFRSSLLWKLSSS